MKREKIIVPMYKMSLQEYYLLLRLTMKTENKKRINGVGKDFFAPETYRNSDKLLKSLAKKKYAENKEEGFFVKEGLQKILNDILYSAYCMNFQNALLIKKGRILSVYYAGGRFTGVLLDRKETILVSSSEPQAIYVAFEKIFEAKAVSDSFKPIEWNKLFDAGSDTLLNPVREAAVLHSFNAGMCDRSTVSMVADKKKLQIIRAKDSDKFKELQRESLPAAGWYGAVMREFERLKQNNEKTAGRKTKAAPIPKPKTEYEQITAAPDFPSSGPGFVFWSLKRLILNFPGMVKGMIQKKSLALLLYPLWAVVLFFYNLYITCYFNDTFMLDRRSRWGSLSPYLMAGTIRTPNELKGFQMDWGAIDTVFLVWPLMMLLTLLGRHLILQIKTRKLSFVTDIFGIKNQYADCIREGFGKGRTMWLTLAFCWLFGFAVMNPVTLFLISLLCFLIFAQGKDNKAVQFVMLWACASGRKRIDAGKKRQPDSRKYLIFFFHMGWGMALYGLISVLLWFLADYYFPVRLIITLLMVAFAVLQAMWPGMLRGKADVHTIRTFLVFTVVLSAALWLSAQMGFVFADDGGWSESGGTLGGLLQNAGFSTILGITAMTIGLALGGPLAWVAAGSCILGGLTFTVGLTDTKAGEYIRKSAKQYFFGADDGESQTLLCTSTQIANFIAGFLNPAAGSGSAVMKWFQSGKIVDDLISTGFDSFSAGMDLGNYISGTGEVDAGDLMMDALGLYFDVTGFSGDMEELDDILANPDIVAPHGKLKQTYDKIKELEVNRATAAESMQNRLNAEKQLELNAELNRHNAKVDEIRNTIEQVRNGEINPPQNVDRETYLQELQNSLNADARISDQTRTQIEDRFSNRMQEQMQQLEDTYKTDRNQALKTFWDDVKGDIPSTAYDLQDLLQNLFPDMEPPGIEELQEMLKELENSDS